MRKLINSLIFYTVSLVDDVLTTIKFTIKQFFALSKYESVNIFMHLGNNYLMFHPQNTTNRTVFSDSMIYKAQATKLGY